MNQPAFPLHNHGAQTLGMHLSGMTLRDYFAAKAMQGILAAWATGIPPLKETTQAAYAFADAMLKERVA